MTAFPNVDIIRIDTRESVTGQETEGVDKIEDITEKLTPDVIDELLGDRDQLIYTMVVTAPMEAGARAKAKAYVRAKNPFEITNVQITSIDKISEMNIRNRYNVAVGITKEGLGD